jgi:hypothetical protein
MIIAIRRSVKKPSLILLMLTVVYMLQGCDFLTKQSDTEFNENGGVEKVFNILGATQIQEYAQSGKIASTLELNVFCYEGYSIISEERAEVTNVVVNAGCEDRGAYLHKIMIVEKGQSDREVVEIICSSVRYLKSELQDRAVEIQPVKTKPLCPVDVSGRVPGGAGTAEYRSYPIELEPSLRPEFESWIEDWPKP